MPLCFPDGACPTSNGRLAHPQSTDIHDGGGPGCARGRARGDPVHPKSQGHLDPYDVPVALAALKVPMGALTAILGLVAIQGEFIPGLSQLDSQGQILAYALVRVSPSRRSPGCWTSRLRPPRGPAGRDRRPTDPEGPRPSPAPAAGGATGHRGQHAT